MNRIFLVGDTHGDLDIYKLQSQRFPEGINLTKNDYIIILGDVAILWSDNKSELIKWYDSQPWTTLWIDGNHENHHKIQKLKSVKKFNSIVGKVSNSIFHLKRGHVYDICGKKIFCMGGAESIDKMHRYEGISWWREEIPSTQEFNLGFDNIEKCNYEVDYVLTHTCPEYIQNELIRLNQIYNLKFNDPTCKYLEVIREKLNFKQWYFGHFHLDVTIKKNTIVCMKIL